MKIAILGDTGLLGHQLGQSLAKQHDVCAPLLYVNAGDMDVVALALGWAQPDVVINCIGVVKQRAASLDEAIYTNGLFPHKLAQVTRNINARLIHFSTDCVFSGLLGGYTELDVPDPRDFYGQTKLLGEVDYENCITLRTSFIGRDPHHNRGLLEWLLAQKTATVPGWIRTFFSGVTTIEMGRIVEKVLEGPSRSGVWHVGGNAISKYSLLYKLAQHYKLPATVVPDYNQVCDRSLNSSRFNKQFNYTPPTWDEMIEELS